VKRWPALDVPHAGDPDLLLAFVDDFAPSAVEERDAVLRIFFSTSASRDSAAQALAERAIATTSLDVDDEDWARRSQENLKPIRIGRIVVVPDRPAPSAQPPGPAALQIAILPSMGFGTGHHPTTRLCLRALQARDVTGAIVLDVGTGSGVLAIAAARLGAARAIGVDSDPDAIHAARENLTLNPEARGVAFDVADLTSAVLPQADIVTANLTGALLVRMADVLRGLVRSDGVLILSGLLADERAGVLSAFAGMPIAWEAEEDLWVGLCLQAVTKI
jgi:ribosomal protein L11 methyltransferase